MEPFEIGEMVFATENIRNDGGIPEVAPDALLARPGCRGVVLRHGHTAAAPKVAIYLVRFEDEQGVLGPPVGCVADELSRYAPGAGV